MELGGCGALAWFVTKDSKISQSGETFNNLDSSPATTSISPSSEKTARDVTDNCSVIQSLSDFEEILSELSIEDQEDYVMVACKDTNVSEEVGIGEIKLPNEWEGVFPANFFINSNDSIKLGAVFTLYTETSQTDEGEYQTEFTGNTINGPTVRRWEDSHKKVKGKSIITLNMSEGEDSQDCAYLLWDTPSKR